MQSHNLHQLTFCSGGGDGLTLVLSSVAGVSMVLGVLGCWLGYTAMYPERRDAAQLSIYVTMLAQLLLVAAVAACALLCYVHADRLDDAFKVGFYPRDAELARY